MVGNQIDVVQFLGYAWSRLVESQSEVFSGMNNSGEHGLGDFLAG